MANEKWTITEQEETSLTIETPAPCNNGFYRANVRWDGCIHFEEWETKDERDAYLHICDIDDHIALLQELRAKALAHFGSEWIEGL